MLNKIVKYHNDINSASLREFTATELDIFVAIVSCMRDKGEEAVIFTFDEIKKLIHWKPKDNERFLLLLKSTYDKLLKCNIKIGDDKEWTSFVLFTKYTVSSRKSEVTIAINKEFYYVLNVLLSNFTRFELDEFLALKSKYAKEFYRRMKQFRTTGFWKISLEEFKRVMDIPEKYKIDTVDKFIFDPIMAELGDKYKLKINKLYTKGGRGRPSVCGFEFSFLKDNERRNDFADNTLSNISELESKETEKTLISEIPPEGQKSDMKTFDGAIYLGRTMRVHDKSFGRDNYLKILHVYYNTEVGKVFVDVRNMDDEHINTMRFNNVKIWDRFFKSHVI